MLAKLNSCWFMYVHAKAWLNVATPCKKITSQKFVLEAFPDSQIFQLAK